MLYWVELFLALLIRPFVKITWRGLENIPKSGPLVVASNHELFGWDVILLGLMLAPRKIHFMAKADFFRRKYIGWLLKKSGAFSAERFTAVSQANRLLEKGKIVGIFPEGALPENQNGFAIKGGVAIIAAKNCTPILPIQIIYGNERHFFPTATVICRRPFSSNNRRLIINYLQLIMLNTNSCSPHATD